METRAARSAQKAGDGLEQLFFGAGVDALAVTAFSDENAASGAKPDPPALRLEVVDLWNSGSDQYI